MTAPSEPPPLVPGPASVTRTDASAHQISARLLPSFHLAMGGVVLIDAARRIVLLNRETERMFGYPAKRLIGKPLEVLFSILSQAHYEPQVQAWQTAGDGAPEAPVTLELQGVRAYGEEFPLEVDISLLAADGERYLAFALREKTPGLALEHLPAPTYSQMRQLSASSHQANEVERRRFSRELYDDLGQNLSVLKLDLDWLQQACIDSGAPLQTRVAHMQTVLDSIIIHTKSIASALRPPLLDDFGLVAALQWACERFQKKTGIPCTLQSGDFTTPVGEPHDSAIFRVVQEGLLNIERHANASHVSLALWRTRDHLHVLLRDNGSGMAPHCRDQAGRFGLAVMQQRIYSLNGKIEIVNVQPSGVEIHASLPLEPAAVNPP